MKVKEFNVEVKEYLTNGGRKQSWLREKMAEKGIILLKSSLSERISGAINFTYQEVKVIQSIMKKYK